MSALSRVGLAVVADRIRRLCRETNKTIHVCIVTGGAKLQALLYNILPPTTAIIDYAIGLEKNSQLADSFFVGAQMEVSLQQTTQIISCVSFITTHVAYASINKPNSLESRQNSLFLPGADAPHIYVHVWTLYCIHSLISTQTFQRVLKASVDSCKEIKNGPSVA